VEASLFTDVTAGPIRSRMALPFNTDKGSGRFGTLYGTPDRRFGSSDGLEAIEGRWRGCLAASCALALATGRERLGGLACSRRRVGGLVSTSDYGRECWCVAIEPGRE
jgi:hypothetical protein